MNDIFDFIALIQFVGAFNFAFVFEEFYNKFESMFDLSKIVKNTFNNNKYNIIADYESIQKMEPICTTEGYSNKDELLSLKKDFAVEMEKFKKGEYEDKLGEKIKTSYIERLFLMIGLYSIYDLFFIAILKFTSDSISWCYGYTVLNFTNTSFLVYFILCEILSSFNINKKFFSPSYRWTVTVSIVLFAISVCIGLFCSQINIELNKVYFVTLVLGVILPTCGFVCSFLVMLSKYFVFRKMKDVICKLTDMHTRKTTLDAIYNMLKSKETKFG